MDSSTLGLILGIKMSVFVILLIYVLMADISLRTKGVYWLNITALSFIVVTLWELTHLFGLSDINYTMLPWLLPTEALNIFAVALYALAGIGILLFLNHVNNNISKYR